MDLAKGQHYRGMYMLGKYSALDRVIPFALLPAANFDGSRVRPLPFSAALNSLIGKYIPLFSNRPFVRTCTIDRYYNPESFAVGARTLLSLSLSLILFYFLSSLVGVVTLRLDIC